MKREKWQKLYYRGTDSPGSDDKTYGCRQGGDYRHPTWLCKGLIMPDWPNLLQWSECANGYGTSNWCHLAGFL